MSIVIIPFPAIVELEGISTRGTVLFEQECNYSDGDDLIVLEQNLLNSLEDSLQCWLMSLQEDSVVYEALTAISKSFKEIELLAGVCVEHLGNYQGGEVQKYLRVSQSFHLKCDNEKKVFVDGEDQLKIKVENKELIYQEAISWVRWFVHTAPIEEPVVVGLTTETAKKWLENIDEIGTKA